MRQVLIVDDEPSLCRCLEQYFKVKGFEVKTAFSGEEAMARVKEGPIDLVLIDIMLPGIHGIEVLKHVRKACPGARVVMMTGLEHDDLRREASLLGATAYVTKPFDFTDSTWSSLLATPA